jgi:hypothetical protein
MHVTTFLMRYSIDAVGTKLFLVASSARTSFGSKVDDAATDEDEDEEDEDEDDDDEDDDDEDNGTAASIIV